MNRIKTWLLVTVMSITSAQMVCAQKPIPKIIMLNGDKKSGGNYFSTKNSGKKTTGFVSGASTTTETFSTIVEMKIYMDNGQNIFAQSHQSFWNVEDAYTVTLTYLLKRSPLYKK
ncbi:MAG: hypothetical protein U5K54_00115 [Cytophagales bacterium]|nr:hypothetical protein [Cytophagales bacterium]